MQRPSQLLNFIKGFSDGLVLPFACITALLQLTSISKNYIYITGVVIIIFSIIHAISYYLTQKAHTRIANNTKSFTGIGLSTEVEKNILSEHEEEKKAWQVIIENNPYNAKQVMEHTLFAGLGYASAGILLMLAFFFYPVVTAYKASCIICFICLLSGSYFKAKLLQANFLAVFIRNLFYVIALSVMAYFLAGLFLK